MSFYVPAVQRIASERLGEPVAVGDLHFAIFPSPKIRLDDVKIGQQLDIRVRTIELDPNLASLFENTIRIKRVFLQEPQLSADALPRVVSWFQREGGQSKVEFRWIVLKSAKLAVPDVDLPGIDGDVRLGLDGSFKGAELRLSDGSLKGTVQPGEGPMQVTLSGRGWKPTFGPGVMFNDITAKGQIEGTTLALTAIDGTMHSGVFQGTARIDWGSGWGAKGEFTTERIELSSLMESVTKDARASGALQSKTQFALTAPKVGGLFDNPQVRSTFTLTNGSLDGVDLIRALQTPRSEGVRGGRTKLDELTGVLTVSGGRYQYRDLKMKAGLMTASGSFDIDGAQRINGRVQMELRSPSNQFRGKFGVDGDLKAIVLKP
jgi:uncharacterized protein involved in outer membrane biogenesis